MKIKKTPGKIIFDIFNYMVLITASLLCVLPFVHLLAISLSDVAAVSAGRVTFWPVGFCTSAYQYVVDNPKFISALLVTIKRVILGVSINLFVIILTAYPLSKSKARFKSRGFYAWFFMFTMLFFPSMIPKYLAIDRLGLIDTIWALVLPGALPVFNMVVMMNFFRSLPPELEEAALIDGASQWKILTSIYIPLSKPSIATITLFCIVQHWNSWFDGILYMNSDSKYPLQSYLQTVVANPEMLLQSAGDDPSVIELLSLINNQTAKAAQLFVAMIPVLLAYPFLQKHFTKGLVMGSVKG